MKKKMKSDSPLDAATCSGFFIVNDFDRPDEERIAGKAPVVCRGLFSLFRITP